MTWTIFFTVLMTPQTLNLLFAALCFAASRGFCATWTLRISALLYIALAFTPEAAIGGL